MARKKAENEIPAGTVDVGGGVVAEEVKPNRRGRRGVAEVVDNDPLGVGDDGDTPVTEKDFLGETADEDRKTTKARHVDDGLTALLEEVGRMRKALAYAAVCPDFGTKIAVLGELADTAGNVRDDARRLLREAKKPGGPNLQPGPSGG